MIALIVEGINDIKKISMVLKNNVRYIQLHGINFSFQKKEEIQEAIETCDHVYILTDPDKAGDKVALQIQESFPQLERILVNPDEAKVLKKRGYRYGVEYCNNEYLRYLFARHFPLAAHV
ncbi:hypothetical protein CN918_30370 [Priestia megaterium]|nr:hypothetical protein CN918_30370 [Priestia megaterium]